MLEIIEVRGKDAAEFLARVTAGSVKGLPPGEGRAGLLLNGQSRVLAQFDLLRLENDRFLLAAPVECAHALAEGLEQLHFAESLEIMRVGTRVGAVRDESARRTEPFPAGSALSWPSPVPGFRFDASSSARPAGFDFARIGALVPWPGTEWAAGETPALEAAMLPWIDRDKGCYPGQEVVERSLNVGHPARVIVAVEGGGPAAWEGAAILTTAQENGKWRALVRLPWAKKGIFPPGISRIGGHW